MISKISFTGLGFTKSKIIFCRNKDEYIKTQEKSFEMGYKWNSGQKTIYFPRGNVNWNKGVYVILGSNKRLLFSDIKYDNAISYNDWINTSYKWSDKSIENFVNNLFEFE